MASVQGVQADTAGDLAAAQARKTVIEQVRQQLGMNLAEALRAQDELSQSLHDNLVQQGVLQGRITETQDKIATLNAQIEARQAEIEKTRARIVMERLQIKSLARAVYVQPGSMLLMLVESQSLGEMLTRINDLRSASLRAQALKLQLNVDLNEMNHQLELQKSDRDEVVKQRDSLQADLGKLEDLHAKQERAQEDLAQKTAQIRYEINAVSSQSSDLAQKIANLLQDEEGQIIAAAMQAVWDQVATIRPTGLPTSQSAGHSQRYRFVWPLPHATETQPFGPCSYWFEPPYGSFPHFHTGIDMADAEGTPVQAADDGVVVMAGGSVVNGQLVGYGNYVVIDHAGGLTTLYGHLASVIVKVGQQVTQGAVVGLEGSTGNSTGAHLHFELRQGTTPIDPAPFLPTGPPSDYRG